MMIKLDAKQLRDYEPTEEEVGAIGRNEIYIIIDNVLDTFNIGSIFRVADAVAAKKVYLVGESAGPEDPKVGHRVHKGSVGTHRWVPWQHFDTVKDAVQEIKSQNSKVRIVAIEQSKNAVDYREVEFETPVALIVGHETRGVSSEGLELADIIVELPLFGVNKSLNVLVALSIVCYKIVEEI
jgi:tRNA G18 (ribose-2'-O)-methylase SpoU